MELSKELSDEIKSSYLDYAMSVIIGRALPDVRDGLKPVQRRILYSMYEMGLFSNKPFRKSARIVGDVLGKYHPHGDAAVYETLVRMAQDFNMRYPLIEGHGNFGSIDGDEAAAMRYTEARLTKIAEEMLKDIEKNTVDFTPNFDGSLKEPSVLPSRIPNLLINGSSGIAVGMTTNIPPHNISEICDAIIAYINNEEISVRELMKYVKAPDFPTGGVIVGVDGIIQAYETGKGKIVLRGKVEVEKNAIIIKEIPYQLKKSKIVEKIAELIADGKLEDVKTVRDESNREGIRIVVELKQNANVEVVINKLFFYTPLQTTFSIVCLALVNNRPRILNLKELIAEFVNHRREIIKRRTEYELKKAEERIHIVEGLKKALEDIDKVVEIIKLSKSPDFAKKRLIENFNFSEKQSEAILQMRLQKLTSIEMESVKKEYEELKKKIKELSEILSSPKKIDSIIVNDMIEIKEKYGDKRKTDVVIKADEINAEDLVTEEDNLILITKNNFAKRMDISSFKIQRRGGVGIIGISLKDDSPNILAKVNSLDRLLIFTKNGRAYSLNAYEIPKQDRTSRGINLKNLLNISDEIVAVLPYESDVIILTEDGHIKLVNVEEFKNAKKFGIVASPTRIACVKPLKGKEVIISTKRGRLVRFKAEEIPEYGRNAKGVKAITLNGDEIAWMDCYNGEKILSLTKKGYGKITDLKQYRLTSRGAKGVLNYRINEKTGEVVFTEVVKSDTLLIISEDGYALALNSNDIPKKGRNTSGVIVSKKGVKTATFI